MGGNFEEWDLQVFPPLQDFVNRTKRAQLQVLNALVGVPCLLEHPEVKPYHKMVEGYGLGFDLPQGGTDDGEKKSLPSLVSVEAVTPIRSRVSCALSQQGEPSSFGVSWLLEMLYAQNTRRRFCHCPAAPCRPA